MTSPLLLGGIATSQPLDSDLTSIAGLITTAFGRGLLDDADAAAGRASLGLDAVYESLGAIRATSASGRYLAMQSDSISDTVTTLSELQLTPLWIDGSFTLDRIGAQVATGGGAGAVIRLGIFGTTAGLPDARLVDAGTIDATSATAQEITISLAVTPGLYWIGAASQVATCTAKTVGEPTGIGLSAATLATALGASHCMYWKSSVTGAFPANVGATSGTGKANIRVAVRRA